MGTSPKELVLFRTHVFNDRVAAVLDRLSRRSNRRVVVVADESKKELRTPEEIEKLSLTRAAVEAAGLFCPGDVGWRCGDYSFYLASPLLRGIEFVWLVEHDLHINFEREADFFDRFSNEPHDLLGVEFKRASKAWSWYSRMGAYQQDVHYCLFPLVRLSRRAVDALLADRRSMSEAFAKTGVEGTYPNDEAFVATMLKARGFSCESINSFGHRYYGAGTTFSLNRPFSRAALESAEADGLLYHPAVYGNDFVRKARAYIRNATTPEELDGFAEYLSRSANHECAENAPKLVEQAREAAASLRSATSPGAAQSMGVCTP